MNDKHFSAWKKLRQKGQAHYIFVYGVLIYGLPMLIVMSIMQHSFVDGYFTKQAIIHCIIWIIAGLVYGTIMWYVGEYKYAKELVRREQSQ